MYKRIMLLGFTLIFIACSDNLNERAEKLHDKIISIDTHTDTPFNLLDEGFDIGKWNNFDETRTRVDFPRMQAGRLDAVFMAVFLGQGERTPDGNRKAKKRALRVLKVLHEKVGEYPNLAKIALNAADIEQIKKQGKHAVYIGIENGYPIGTDINMIDTFYNLGARYITLSHTKNNDICDSSTDPKGAEYNGLSLFGEQVVERMNNLGFMIDVSHISDSAFFDVIRLSKAPIIASHSSVRAVCDNPRNFSDEMLLALKENGGVIQICILSDYIKTLPKNPKRDSAFNVLRKKYNYYKNLTEEQHKLAVKDWLATEKKFPQELATVSDVVDHIDYVVNKIGVDYVGIGTDFDGGGGVNGCIDASQLKNITIELLRRGYNDKEIEKIWGGNFLRVFKEVENQKKKI
ncbi:MAG: dipeptidase [Bacteroidales bacterium]|nr:dipeptidase [Bacteroidales bacterium]